MTIKSGFFTCFKLLVIMVTAASAFHGAEATEGGSSHYVPGLYNDFFMNMQLEPGVHFRDDLMYYGAQFPNSVTLGRNYWSFDTIAGLTWLHPTRGHEISFNVGFMSNTENGATQYQSGDEFHMDYTVAQHFSEEFGIGVTGYYYHQLSNDKSPLLERLQQVINERNQLRQISGRPALPEVGGFQGEAAGIGPIIRYSPKFDDKQVHFIGKWIHEFDVQNRFKGEIGMFSVALDF